MAEQLYLDFDNCASVKIRFSAETTVDDVCRVVAESFLEGFSAEQLMLLTKSGEVLSKRQRSLRSLQISGNQRLQVKEITALLYLDFENRPSVAIPLLAETSIEDVYRIVADSFLSGFSAEQLMLLTKSGEVLSNHQRSLNSLNITDNQRLLVLLSRRIPVIGSPAWLREESMGDIYPISWHPALIGRPGHIRDRELLAANLEWLPNGRTISRNHALIVERSGAFYIYHLPGERNITKVNGVQMVSDVPMRLRHNDEILLGEMGIAVRFLRYRTAETVVFEPTST